MKLQIIGYDDALSLLATTTDLLNSWAREMHVREAYNEWEIKEVVDRLWSELSTRLFADKHAKLEEGLKAHHFVRMTFSGRMGQIFSHEKENFECSCGSEFGDEEQFREHQNLHLRIFLGISEKVQE